MPAGSTIGLCIYLVHRNEAIFSQPDRFLPDRFLSMRPSRFEYLPFGGGRRGCVAGPLFVLLEKLILASALDHLEFDLCDYRENPVTSMSLVSTQARPLWVIARRLSSWCPRTAPMTPLRADGPDVATQVVTARLNPTYRPHSTPGSGTHYSPEPRDPP
jgi:hypothetical protein